MADNAPAATRDQGFKDGTNTGPDYEYDGNGNITYDYNKRISFTYNRLNLPIQITSGSNKIVYYYNFLGEKYKKEVYTGSTVTDTRYYLDEIEYKNNAIDFVHTSEGRAIKNGKSYYYEYALTDHTGSTRVTFADRGNNGKISTEQIGAYYPYGLQYSDPNQTRMTPPQNLYTYQGNETQQDLNINLSDFNARQYDPALGRFLSHDPDDQFADLSPYAAFGNNPINNVDPGGRSFFDLAVGLAGLGAVIGGIADGSSSGKGFFAGLAAGFIAGIVGREGIGGITSIGLNLGTGGYNDLGSSKGFFGKTQKTLGDLASKVPSLSNLGTDKSIIPDIKSQNIASNMGIQNPEDSRISILKYKPYKDEFGRPGVDIDLGYSDVYKGFDDLNWIQNIITNTTPDGRVTQYIDKDPGQESPFYANPATDDVQKLTNHQGYVFSFRDQPTRGNTKDFSFWIGELSLVGSKQGVFHEILTLKYGFEILNRHLKLYPIQFTNPSSFQLKAIQWHPINFFFLH